MEYKRMPLKTTFAIHKIISLYYYEFGTEYRFPGELHDFWELAYVDKGEVIARADDTLHHLGQGMIIFHKPNEFHSIQACNGTAPNVIVMAFECRSRAMRQFENRRFALQDEERQLLTQIIAEGMRAFRFPFRYPLTRLPDAPPGGEQVIRLSLELLLIRLLRRGDSGGKTAPLSSLSREKDVRDLTDDMLRFMEQRLYGPMTLDEMSRALRRSKTMLKTLFKKKTGSGIMQYFTRLKMEKAKQLIRENNHNVTEIAALLGFSSVHYFSAAFKRTMGMSPSEYAKSVHLQTMAASDPLRLGPK